MYVGNLSDHFNHEDFACRCPECKGSYRIHLGLVGALEQIGGYFKKKVNVISAYWCDDYYEKLDKPRRSFHTMGKAAHIKIDGVSLQELFKYAETMPELCGVGLYPKEDFVHIDTRQDNPVRWIKEGKNYISLTPDKRVKYGLG